MRATSSSSASTRTSANPRRLVCASASATDGDALKLLAYQATGLDGASFGVQVPVIATDKERFNAFFHGMLDRGVYLPPSQFEAAFVSTAHGEAELAHTLEAARAAIRDL